MVAVRAVPVWVVRVVPVIDAHPPAPPTHIERDGLRHGPALMPTVGQPRHGHVVQGHLKSALGIDAHLRHVSDVGPAGERSLRLGRPCRRALDGAWLVKERRERCEQGSALRREQLAVAVHDHICPGHDCKGERLERWRRVHGTRVIGDRA